MSGGYVSYPATSADLASRISDETGTGPLVLANSPTLVTPTLGVATASKLTLTGAGLSTYLVDLVKNSPSNASGTFPGVRVFNLSVATHSLADLSLIANNGGTNLYLGADGLGTVYPVGGVVGMMSNDRLALITNGLARWEISGAGVHKVSGAFTDVNSLIVGGTYTPTLTAVTNVAASVLFGAQWVRIGPVVIVSGLLTIDPTAASVSTELGISLPLASDLTAVADCCGTAHDDANASNGGSIQGDTTNNRASLKYVPTTAANHAMYFFFMYTVK